jgi:hypothetical protein
MKKSDALKLGIDIDQAWQINPWDGLNRLVDGDEVIAIHPADHEWIMQYKINYDDRHSHQGPHFQVRNSDGTWSDCDSLGIQRFLEFRLYKITAESKATRIAQKERLGSSSIRDWHLPPIGR